MAHLSSASSDTEEGPCFADNASPAELGRIQGVVADCAEEICARIETLIKEFLQSLVSADPSIPSLLLLCRTAKNTRIQEDAHNNRSICLMQATHKRQFTTKSGLKSFIRVWKLLEICYQLLQSGKRATQREIYYRLLSDPASYTRTPEQVNEAIQDVVALLRCSRHSLGIFASGKGLLVGRLLIQEPDGRRVDCTKMGPSHYSIPGDISHLENLAFQSDARYIIVVEKETVFQRLASDRFYHFAPSIIITGKGYPDLATRVMLARLHQAFPALPIVALVDWNPAGLAILCTYKFGSMRMGLETAHYEYGFRNLEYVTRTPELLARGTQLSVSHPVSILPIGCSIRYEDLRYISEEAILDFKGRDKILAESLRNSKLMQNNEGYERELAHMIDSQKRVEVEALHSNGEEFLCKFIADKIVQQDYI